MRALAAALAALALGASACGGQQAGGKTAEKIIKGDWIGSTDFPGHPDLSGSTLTSVGCDPHLDAARQVHCLLHVRLKSGSHEDLRAVATFGTNGVLTRWDFTG
jgi:hypothetical protein